MLWFFLAYYYIDEVFNSIISLYARGTCLEVIKLVLSHFSLLNLGTRCQKKTLEKTERNWLKVKTFCPKCQFQSCHTMNWYNRIQNWWNVIIWISYVKQAVLRESKAIEITYFCGSLSFQLNFKYAKFAKKNNKRKALF